MYEKFNDDCIEDKVIISDDFVNGENNVTEDFSLISLNNEVRDRNELLNKELVFHLDSFCAKAITKYIKFD